MDYFMTLGERYNVDMCHMRVRVTSLQGVSRPDIMLTYAEIPASA